MTGRRGFSLIEVMIGLVTAAVVGTLAAVVTGRLQIAGRARGERTGLTGSLRVVVGALEAELQSLGSDSIAGADHQVVGPSSITFRAHRGLVVVCRIAVDSVVLALDRLPAFRSRLPSSGRDSLLLYVQGDSSSSTDAWLPIPVQGGPFATTCPGGWPGSVYATQLPAGDLARYRIPASGLGRLFETVNARLYSSATGPHFGVEEISAGSVIQPVAGPLRAIAGVDFLAWDRTGGPPATPLLTSGFDVAVRVESARDHAVGPGIAGPARDSVLSGVLLRNAR